MPYNSPFLTLDEEDDPSRFLELFNRIGPQYPDYGQFLEPNDPDLLKYQELSSTPTGSESMISDYVGSMPTREEYNPSLGRKIAAFVLGTLSGNPAQGAEIARRHVERPYEQAVDEWKMEGSNIASRARLMDAERQRQLQAMKYGLQTKASSAKAQAASEARRLAEARRIAGTVANEEARTRAEQDRKLAFDALEEQRRFNRIMAERAQDAREANILEDNTRADEMFKASQEARAARERDFDKINKQLSGYASQRGIDTSDRTAKDIALEAAFEDAMKHKVFADILQRVDDIEGGYQVNPEYANQPVIEALKKFLDMRVAKYLRGEFQ